MKSGGNWNSISDIIGSAAHAEKYKSYAYACINARAENVSKGRVILYKRMKNNGGVEEVKEHPIIELLNHPNRKKQSFKEILHKISTSLDLYGNSYLYIHRGINRKPIGLYFLPSKNVTINLKSDLTEVESYTYTSGCTTVKYKANDIIHFLIPDPDNNVEGRATVSAFNHTLDIDYYQNQYQRNFYLNDASLGMILETDEELGDEQYERLALLIKDNYESFRNTGKTLILDSGMKAKQYNNSPKDVEILPARKMVRDEIMTIFGVPKVMLGITDDVNRANARESLKVFNDYVIKPFAKIYIESKLNIFLEENYKDENLFLYMEYEFEIDRELQLRAYEIYRKYDIASVDEIRSIEGFNFPKSNKP